MKRALVLIALLATALLVALLLRVRHLRAASHGPAGGTGVIEGVDVNVTSRIPTRITSVLVHEGDMVKARQLVVELDCTEPEAALEQAKSQVLAAQATLEAARSSAASTKRNASAVYDTLGVSNSQVAVLQSQEKLANIELERARKLVESGSIGQAALDAAQARHDTIVAQIAAQRATEGATRDQVGAISSAGSAASSQAVAAENNVKAAQSAVSRAEVAVNECKLYAPRDAMVASRNMEPGEAVLPGMAILSLSDVTEARTRFYLPNDDLAAAAPGRAVKVSADAYPNETFPGTIFFVNPNAEFTPRNVQTREDRERLVYAVEVRIPNDKMRLRAGMPVEVAIDGTWR